VGACSPRLFNFYFVLHGGCPCSCLWDPIPFLGLASAGENVPLHSPFEFACNVLLATSLYRKLVLLFLILIYSYICSEEWQTVRKKKHNSGNKRQTSTTSLPAECNLPPQRHVPSKGKAPALSVDTPGSKAPHRPGSSVLTRSSVQKIPNRSSGSGGIAPTLPHP